MGKRSAWRAWSRHALGVAVETHPEQAADARVVVRIATGLRSAHDLFREVLAAGLSALEQARLDRTVGPAAILNRFQRDGALWHSSGPDRSRPTCSIQELMPSCAPRMDDASSAHWNGSLL